MMRPGRIEPSASRGELAALLAFCAATVLLVSVEQYAGGLVLWGISLTLALRSPRPAVRQNLVLLLLLILVLAAAPIHTDLSTSHFLSLGLPFLLVVLAPSLWMKRKLPERADWRFFPRRLFKRDILYTIISVPLAWAIIELYFFHLNPDLAANWPLPQPHSDDAVRRLVIGINCVGIWDELFFLNTVYVLLRVPFPARIANPAQAVVYTSVLWDMAFRGWGPLIVYVFALTQGIMFERSGALLWVLLVHLIIDMFLVLAILQYHYPGHSLRVF